MLYISFGASVVHIHFNSVKRQQHLDIAT